MDIKKVKINCKVVARDSSRRNTLQNGSTDASYASEQTTPAIAPGKHPGFDSLRY